MKKLLILFIILIGGCTKEEITSNNKNTTISNVLENTTWFLVRKNQNLIEEWKLIFKEYKEVSLANLYENETDFINNKILTVYTLNDTSTYKLTTDNIITFISKSGYINIMNIEIYKDSLVIKDSNKISNTYFKTRTLPK
jgi:hypothetical protein